MKIFQLTAIVLLFIQCNADKQNPDRSIGVEVRPHKTLNAAFLIVDGVYNSELIAPMDVLHHTVFHTDPAVQVFTVAPKLDTIETFEGLKIIPDYSFNSIDLPKIDILVVPSAEGSMGNDLKNVELINFVKEIGDSSDYIMSLCDGAFVLAQAGLLQELESSTFPSDITRFREMFPSLVVHEGVSFVRDGKAITSAGGAKSYDPALFLVERLYGKQVADGIAKGLVIDWNLSSVKHIEVQ